MSVFEERLRELQRLRTSDAITQGEYEKGRDAVLDQLSSVELPRKGLNAVQRVYLILGVIALIIVGFYVIFGAASIVLAVLPGGTSTMAGSGSAYEAPTSSDVANGSLAARLSLIRIDDPAAPSGGASVPEGKRYIATQVTLENVGHRDLKAADFRLRTWGGSEYSPKIVPEVGAAGLEFLKNVPPGEIRTGMIAFEVPQNATVQWLRYRSNPSGIEMLFGEEN
jgi:hypothetical protein